MISFQKRKKVLVAINNFSEKNWNRLAAALEPAEIVLVKHDDHTESFERGGTI